jgi:hypothetical protein
VPRIEKVGTFEAVWAAPDEYIVNQATGKQGKCMAGKIRITKLETGRRWYVDADDFRDSGWTGIDAPTPDYFRQPPTEEPS